MPTISVILPVYNCEQYISQAIESILTQTYTDFELIIINDGSKDDTLEIVKKYKNIDSRVKVINRVNKGLIYSLNEGISIATGKYIARMDADDICLPHRLEKQVSLMEANNLDICGGHYLEIESNETIKCLRLVPISLNIINLSLVSTVPFAHPTVIFRKSFIDKQEITYGSNGFHHAEDLALWYNLKLNGARFGNVNDIILKYRLLSTSLSRRNKNNLIRDTRVINHKYFTNTSFTTDDISKCKREISNKTDAKILAEYIWCSVINKGRISLISKLPFHFKKEIIFSFFRQLKVFLDIKFKYRNYK